MGLTGEVSEYSEDSAAVPAGGSSAGAGDEGQRSPSLSGVQPQGPSSAFDPGAAAAGSDPRHLLLKDGRSLLGVPVIR